MCLAPLLRDMQFAITCGDDGFACAFRRLLLRAIAIGRRGGTRRDTTPAHYQADLERRLTRVMALPRRGEAAGKLRCRITRDRAHLFLFATDRAVSATTNACERAAAERDLPQGDQRPLRPRRPSQRAGHRVSARGRGNSGESNYNNNTTHIISNNNGK